jgi:hypothetical protein
MAIADIAASKPSASSKGPTCQTCAALAKLPDDEATALRALLSDPAWRYSELSERLRDEGVDIADFNLARHARGGCSAREKLR